MDFTNLNKAYPKYSFFIPTIDRLVDVSTGHKVLSFMAIFSSYNQIKMDSIDQEKTTIITEEGLVILL